MTLLEQLKTKLANRQGDLNRIAAESSVARRAIQKLMHSPGHDPRWSTIERLWTWFERER